MATTKQAAHGTSARYRQGCRCDKCRKWKSDSQAKYRADRAAREGKAKPSKRAPRSPVPPTSAVPTHTRPAPTARAASGDELVRIIEAALFDTDSPMAAAVLAAQMIREAGWRHVVDGPIEAAARDAFDASTDDASTRLRHELVFRGARSLDDPANARYFASTVEAMRKVLADIAGPDGDGGGAGDIVDAIRRAGRDGDGDP
ncbi:hypothetical protein [Microbacterium maritypicum]|uniref:hypothetical protein n=1 Tax=Microbacterium maritypicum TaxID=33918 RepID=UPI0038018A0A